MTATQRERIEQHGRNLLAIFPNATEQDPVELCKKLRRLESVAGRLALENCNVGVPDNEYWERKERILSKVQTLLGYATGEVPVFFNGDPRGYALKIEDAYVREHNLTIERDWGGYGIIAPEIK